MIGCINAGSFIYDGGIKTYQSLQQNFTIYGTLVAFDIALDPVYHIADINYSCFVGGQEAYLVGLKYLTLFNDPLTILYN